MTLASALSSPRKIQRRRSLAESMIQQGSDTSPVQHPFQALARVMQGGIGGYMAGKADREEDAGLAGVMQKLQNKDWQGAATDQFATPAQAQWAQGQYETENKPDEFISVDKKLYNKSKGQWVDMPQGAAVQPDFTEQLSLTNQVLKAPGVQRFNETLPLLRSMGESIQDNRSASDMDFIYGAALTMSPDGRVTDQDAQLMSDNQSVRDRIRGEIQAAFRGEGKLSPTARRALYDLALRRVGQYRKQAEEDMGFYGQIAQPGGFQLPQLGAMPEAIPPLPPEMEQQELQQQGQPQIMQGNPAPQPDPEGWIPGPNGTRIRQIR